jgi:hypothetical protein
MGPYTNAQERRGCIHRRNGFRAIGVIEALEENLDRPILTAN